MQIPKGLNTQCDDKFNGLCKQSEIIQQTKLVKSDREGKLLEWSVTTKSISNWLHKIKHKVDSFLNNLNERVKNSFHNME